MNDPHDGREIRRVYGPYTASSGRLFVTLKYTDGSRRSQFYSRFLWERRHGRKIPPGLQVDHVDEDPTNEQVGNYQLLTGPENIAKHVAMKGKSAEVVHLACSECGQPFESLARRERRRVKQGKAGPFCSKQCAGRANQRFQKAFNGGRPRKNLS